MSSASISFNELILRVRAGEEEAATEIVRRYEPAIRRAVRFRIDNSHLKRVMDSVDLCQSVMASFFLRAAAGQYDIDEPEKLSKLLVAIARNKIAMHARAQQRQCRDQRRVQALSEPGFEPTGNEPTPSQNISGQELLQAAQRLMSLEERQLLEWRKDGIGWEEIAQRMQGSPEALRKKLSRALDAVAHRLQLDDYSHD
jgi:RNA polymerase sigma-70 factor (ECF subfamily)